MELRNGKCLPPAPSNRVTRCKSRPFRLLDLPQELRLIIYGYAFGCHNLHWMMTYEYGPVHGFRLALGYRYRLTSIHRVVDPHPHRSNLLRTCKQVLHEAFLIFYDQTRFDVGFCQPDVLRRYSAYRLQVTHRKTQLIEGLARVVLQRVKHVRFDFSDEARDDPCFWRLHLLGVLLGHGACLKSLRFIGNGDVNILRNSTWYTRRSLLEYKSFRGDAILELRNAKLTDEEIAEIKWDLECILHSCYSRLDDKMLMVLQGRNPHFPLVYSERMRSQATRRICGPRLLNDVHTAG